MAAYHLGRSYVPLLVNHDLDNYITCNVGDTSYLRVLGLNFAQYLTAERTACYTPQWRFASLSHGGLPAQAKGEQHLSCYHQRISIDQHRMVFPFLDRS